MRIMRIMSRPRRTRIMRPEPLQPLEGKVTAPINIWSTYGLAANPFFQEELRSDPAAFYPITLHVGREDELRLAARQLGGGPSSRIVVEGAPGIGKTSFVNKLKAELSSAGMLTHAEPVRIVADSTVLSFVADVLRVLLRVRSAALLPVDAFWTRTARLVEGEDTMAGGVTLGPVGVSFQGGRVPAEAPLGTLYEVVAEGVDRLARELSTGILLHVNNLENLSESEASQASRLMRDLRDFLLLPGAHWIFAGASGVDDTVFRAYDQVAGIFPEPIVLNALTQAEVSELIRRRYAFLTVNRTAMVPPVDPEVAAGLYQLYQGDLRNFLRLLSDAAALALGVEGIEPMTSERIVAVAAPRYAKSIERRIGAADMAYLSQAVRKSMGGEVNVTAIAQTTGLGQSGASRLMSRLRESGLVVQSRTEGKRVFYRPAGQVLIALGIPPGAD
ncbi:MAG TPA: AAA family ATPase [Longimicrobium sp.]